MGQSSESTLPLPESDGKESATRRKEAQKNSDGSQDPRGESAKPVWLTAPDEYAAEEVGRWVVVPRDRTDAMLFRGVRKQVTREVAMAQHRTHIETALALMFPVAIASIQYHGLVLPKGYIRHGEFYVNRRLKKWRQLLR